MQGSGAMRRQAFLPIALTESSAQEGLTNRQTDRFALWVRIVPTPSRRSNALRESIVRRGLLLKTIAKLGTSVRRLRRKTNVRMRHTVPRELSMRDRVPLGSTARFQIHHLSVPMGSTVQRTLRRWQSAPRARSARRLPKNLHVLAPHTVQSGQ